MLLNVNMWDPSVNFHCRMSWCNLHILSDKKDLIVSSQFFFQNGETEEESIFFVFIHEKFTFPKGTVKCPNLDKISDRADKVDSLPLPLESGTSHGKLEHA